MLNKLLTKLLNNKRVRKHRSLIMLAMDLTLVIIALWCGFFFEYGRVVFEKNIDLTLYTITIATVIYAISFYVFGIAKSLWKYISTKELITIGVAIAIDTIILLAIKAPLSLYNGNKIYITVGFLAFFFMSYIRVIYRWIRYSSGSKDAENKVIIIGAGDGGYLLMKEIMQNSDINEKVVGFVDDSRAGHVIAGIPVKGTTDDLNDLVKELDVSKLYIAMPSADRKTLNRIFDICKQTGVKTQLMKKGQNLLSDTIDDTKYSTQDISIEDLLGRGEIKLDQVEIATYLTKQVVVVTGAGGSIGSELCRQIVKFKPKKLIMIDINENGLYMLEQEFNRYRTHGRLDPNIKIISCIASIREYKAIDGIFKHESPSVVFHAAAHKHVPLMETRPQEAIKNNVFGTKNVIEACINNKIARFIMISTDKAVNPTNVMGATKRMTEMILQANGNNGVTKMAAVRFGNVLGSNGSVIPIFKQQIEEGGPITITHKDIIRYFMTIPEAAQLVLQAGYYADKGEIFVLDMGEPVKILDLAENLIKLSGLVPYKDIDITEIGLRPGEKMFEELKLDGENAIKTKNDLIYKNEVMGIEKSSVDQSLLVLKDKIDNDVSNEELKETILDLIR